MNDLTTFTNPEFGQVRTVEIDGTPWLVGKDVAVALGYKNPQRAIRDHVDAEDKGVTKTVTPSGEQEMLIINESGLYSLILSSKMPKAKAFKRWVTSEVLPAIDEGLVVLLQCIREHFGKPVTITSGYRTASHNTRVGGSKSSQHLLGRAADIQVQDTDPLAVAAYAESLMPGWGGVGRYPVKAGRAKGWVHVDTRPNKSRWTL